MNVTIPNDFTPRPYQLAPMRYLDNGGRKAFIVWHRRSGKDLTMLHQTCKMAHQRKGVYWHVFPSFAQGRKAIWEGITADEKRILENVFPGFLDPRRQGSIIKRKDEQQMMLELKNGSIWRLIGSDNVELVGAGPVGVVFSEFALSSPVASRMISPMLRQNNGWEVYITTPRGPNHAKDLFDSAIKDPVWFTDTKTIYDTRAYDPDATISEERAKGYPEAFIKQEYLCDWTAALSGTVWGEEIAAIDIRGGLVGYEHDLDQVFTSWDLGLTDSTAIWFWRIKDGGCDIIDYYENHGKPLSHYYDIVDGKPYAYVKHWLPHDARQQTLASGVNILNQCLRQWPGKVAIDPDLDIMDGIQAGRWLLQQRVRIHPRCHEGLKALRHYHFVYDEEKKQYSPKPLHDWSSHCFTGETRVLTRNGTQRIMDLPITGEVLTPCGWKAYRNPRIEKRNARLVEVTFASGHSVKCTPDHLFLTAEGWKSAGSLTPGLRIRSALTQEPSSSMAEFIGDGFQANTLGTRSGFIEKFGVQLSDLFRTLATSITETVIQLTTGYPIWSAYRGMTTFANLPTNGKEMGHIPLPMRRLDWPQQSGIGARPEGSGTRSTPEEARAGLNGRGFRDPAKSAARSFRCLIGSRGTSRNTAPTSARLSHSGGDTLTITGVHRLIETADVWDITVPGVECFALENGAVVHNSADAFRYLATVVKVSELLTAKPPAEKPAPPAAKPLHHSFTLEQLFADHSRMISARRRI